VWFPAKADFRSFAFTQEVRFENAVFNDEADFDSATFSNEATFKFVTFHAKATFQAAKFQKSATFLGTIFEQDVFFSKAIFKQRANLKSRFEGTAEFDETEFGDLVEFTNALFTRNANFYKAKFGLITRFDQTEFRGIANLDEVSFSGRVNFNDATFVQDAKFHGALFADRTLFDRVKFKGKVTFYLARFKDFVRFKGNDVGKMDERHKVFEPACPPNFRETKFDHPDLASFHSLHLRPFWFVEVDVRNFALTNVKWDWQVITIEEELAGMRKQDEQQDKPHDKQVRSKEDMYSVLAIAFWNLAVNAEENHRYEEASKFRYFAMELRRRYALFVKPSKYVAGQRSFSGSGGLLHWLYWLMSGYGERIVRASVVLILSWLGFAVLYALKLCDANGPIGWRGLPYSLAVITLQTPDIHPPDVITQTLVTVEVILGPVQAALLALAIRRQFMR
jgi:hypothetical protein